MAYTPAVAAADSGNNQSTTQLCRDADYADLHPTLCPGPFSLTPQGHGGSGSSGPVGGLLHGLTGGLL
jgi:hypothetical protein